MAEPTAYAMSRLFSQLVGREVSFSLVLNPPASKARPLYAVYSELRRDRALVVKADLPLLGCMAGALLGLPVETAVERAQETPMNESLRDAIHEVLNVASTALSTEGRVTLKGMFLDPVYCEGDAADLLRTPDHKCNFNVKIGDEASGLFTILSRI